MNRLAKVVARGNHFVILKLVQAEKCVGCPTNCNEPLVDFFSLRKNLIRLSNKDNNYQLNDPQNLLIKTELLNQLVNIKIDTQDLMKSSAMLYLVPLLICLLFLSIGHLIGSYWQLSTDLTALLGFVFGLLLVFQLARRKNKRQHLNFRPKVTIL